MNKYAFVWHKPLAQDEQSLLTRCCMINGITARFQIQSAVLGFVTSCRFHIFLVSKNERRLQGGNKVSKLKML
jgi:hypothetical protein